MWRERVNRESIDRVEGFFGRRTEAYLTHTRGCIAQALAGSGLGGVKASTFANETCLGAYWFLQFFAPQLYVRGVDLRFDFFFTRLGAQQSIAANVPCYQVATGNQHFVFSGEDREDFCRGQNALFSTDNFNDIAFLDVHGGLLEHFGRERDDAHEVFSAQFSCDRSENTVANGLSLLVEQNGRVFVKTDVASILTSDGRSGTDDHRLVYIAFFHFTAGGCIFDRYNNDIADTCGRTLGSAEHFNALYCACSGVVGDCQSRLHLNHLRTSLESGSALSRKISVPVRSGA